MTFRQIPTAFISNEPGKSIAIGVLVLMAVLFSLQMASLLGGGELQTARTNTPSQGLAQKAISAQSPLFTKPLFGVYVPDLSNAEIKQSSLDFVVVGIMYSKQKNNAEVILQAAGGKEKNYFVGDTLPGGAKIQRIDKTGIIVLYKGSLERLRLPEQELKFDKAPEALPKPLTEE